MTLTKYFELIDMGTNRLDSQVEEMKRWPDSELTLPELIAEAQDILDALADLVGVDRELVA